MTQELRKLAEATLLTEQWYTEKYLDNKIGNGEDSAYIAAANPAAILELLDRLEKAEKDSARLDWLEQNLFNRENVDWITGKVSNTHNMWVTFAPVGVQGSARRIIDSAMEASK